MKFCLEPERIEILLRAREAGEGIKPGAQAPGTNEEKKARARETGDSVMLSRLSPVSRARGGVFIADPGACAPGFMLSPASRALSGFQFSAARGSKQGNKNRVIVGAEVRDGIQD